MKSEYTFAALAKQDVAPGPDADALFFSMLAPVLRGGPLVACDLMAALQMQLTTPAYYVAHKLVAHAGKRVFSRAVWYGPASLTCWYFSMRQ